MKLALREGTAGRVVTEAEFRSYMLCSQQWKFGGAIGLDQRHIVLRSLFEYWLSKKIRNPYEDQDMVLTRGILRAMKTTGANELPANHRNKIKTDCLLWMGEFTHQFDHKYLPQTGPQFFTARADKVAIKLRVSGTMRVKGKNTLNAFHFAPTMSWQDMYNDPLVHAKMIVLGNVIRTRRGNYSNIALHTLSMTENKDKRLVCRTILKEELNAEYLQSLRFGLKGMAAGVAMPRVPCSINCPYKKEHCHMGKKNGKS